MVVLNGAAYGAEYDKFETAGFDPAVCFTNWRGFADIAIGLGGHGVTVRSEARARRGDREPPQPRPTGPDRHHVRSPHWSEAATSRLSKHPTRSPPTWPPTFAAGDSTDRRSAYSRARSRMATSNGLADDSRGGRDRGSAPAVYRVGTLSREQDVLRGRANGRAAPISGHA